MLFYSFEVAAAGQRVFGPEFDMGRKVVGPLFCGRGLCVFCSVGGSVGGDEEEDRCWEGEDACEVHG